MEAHDTSLSMAPQQVDSDFILATLRELSQRLQNEFAIYKIGLYGSYARNEQSPNSDIDLVFAVDNSRYLTLTEREKLYRILRRRLGRKLDLVNEKVMNPFVKYVMQKDVIYVQ